MRSDQLARTSSRKAGRGRRLLWFRPVGALLPALVLAVSCSPGAYRSRADRETYTALFEKTPEVENVEAPDIELVPPRLPDLAPLVKNSRDASFLGEFADSERGAKLMPLDQALDTGIHHNRDYLTTKESVFLTALDLTLARYRLAPIGYAGGNATRAVDSRTARLEEGFTELVSTNTLARNQSAGFNWLLNTGAKLSADFTQDFLRIMTGNQSINQSDVAVTLVQPLLQGGGKTVTLEALTQAERNVLYDLREFADFRRDFIVDLVSDYYGVLLARDVVKNNYVAYRGYIDVVEREEALAEEHRRTQGQLGRLRQAKLRAESRWVAATQAYLSRLDELKITLGIPVDSKLILDENELLGLGIEDPGISREQSVEVALVTRPDLATASDLVDDAERRIKVAENGLLPGLDVSVDYNSVSDPGDTTPEINWDRRRWRGNVDLDLPIDRKAERNIYRASLISVDRARRSEELARDRARLEIYNAWRALDQARLSFRIAEEGVALAARRLEEQLLLAELGRGEARDLVDAQEDLVEAQNQRTATLVNHTLARLRLWSDMGILYIESDGGWVRKLEREKP